MAAAYVANQYIKGICEIPCITCGKTKYNEFIYIDENTARCVECFYKIPSIETPSEFLDEYPIAAANIIIAKYKRNADNIHIQPLVSTAMRHFHHIKIIFPLLIDGIKDSNKQQVFNYIINVFHERAVIAYCNKDHVEWVENIENHFINYTTYLVNYSQDKNAIEYCINLLWNVAFKFSVLGKPEKFAELQKYRALYRSEIAKFNN